MVLDGFDVIGKWNFFVFEMFDIILKGYNMGMIYCVLGVLNISVGEYGNKLVEEFKKKDIEIDNLVKLVEIFILSLNFNFVC